jgi:hypothetical protein
MVMRKLKFIELKKKLTENNTLLSFSGPFSQDLIEDLGTAIKTYLATDRASKSSTYNVFSVFIEQSQNTRNYLTSKASELPGDAFTDSGIVTIGKEADKYLVCSGNLVRTEDAAELAARIDHLNQMTKEELKAEYKEQIKKDRTMDPEKRPGAGMGLIEIARKACADIEYEFIPYDGNDQFVYFIMVVTVG